jgi:hypothetical protein
MELPRLGSRELYCAVAGRYVVVRFLTYDGRRPIGVVACSAYPGGALTCGTPCVPEAGGWAVSRETAG